MFRRQIFYGITLILIIVVVFLLMRGRSAEKEQQTAQNVKMTEVASATPSRVRAILPRDLEIVSAEVSWTRDSGEKDTVTASHNISIRNTGGAFFVSLWIRMEYIDEKGRPVEIRTHEVKESVLPGETLSISDIIIDGLPAAALDFHTTILSADLDF